MTDNEWLFILTIALWNEVDPREIYLCYQER